MPVFGFADDTPEHTSSSTLHLRFLCRAVVCRPSRFHAEQSQITDIYFLVTEYVESEAIITSTKSAFVP
jgi:hypothetical protein